MSEAVRALIAVRGSWTADVPPELSRLRISVGARAGDRATVLRDLTRRIDELRALLDGYAAAVEAVDVGSVRVRPVLKDHRKPSERVSGHVAEVWVTVTVVDFTVLGDLLLRVADREMVAVDGPFWSLRPESDRYRQARTEAVRDARRRAEEYATAAGARLTGLVEIADVGLSAPEHVSIAAPAMEMFSRAAGAPVADEVRFDIDPVPQTVSATVEARFTATQPTFDRDA